VKDGWAGYFERLYQADPPAVEVYVRGVTIPILTLQSTEPPSFVGTQAVVNRLKWGKAPGLCGIKAELQGWWTCCTHVIACSSELCLEHRHHPN